MDANALDEIIEATVAALNEQNDVPGTRWHALPPEAAPNKLVFFLTEV